jgi:hypothetical protein
MRLKIFDGLVANQIIKQSSNWCKFWRGNKARFYSYLILAVSASSPGLPNHVGKSFIAPRRARPRGLRAKGSIAQQNQLGKLIVDASMRKNRRGSEFGFMPMPSLSGQTFAGNFKQVGRLNSGLLGNSIGRRHGFLSRVVLFWVS